MVYMTKGAVARDTADVTIPKSNEISAPCLTATSSILSSPKNERSGWSVFLDQDFLVMRPGQENSDDHNYTMGFGFSSSGISNKEGVLASSRDWLDEQLLVQNDDPSTVIESMHTTSFGMAAYTPDDLENKLVIQGDRPYASLLYVSNTKLRAYMDGGATKTTFMFGLLGLDIAKEIQRYAHNDLKTSKEDPLGWANQISDGGEITALYTIEKKALIGSCYAENKVGGDISYSVSADVGYKINAAVGLNLRWGYIGTPYYLHTATPVSNYSHYSCYECRVRDNYLFLNFRLRAIAYDALLQGQFRDSKLTIDGQNIENIVLEASLGWVYSLSPEWKIMYSVNYKSKEFKGSEAEDHLYGGLYLSKGVLN